MTATSTNPKSAPSLKDENRSARPLAIVTGASAGIGCEFAGKCAVHGFDLLIAADDPKLIDAAREFELLGRAVEAIEVDLSTTNGVDRSRYQGIRRHVRLCASIRNRYRCPSQPQQAPFACFESTYVGDQKMVDWPRAW